MKKKELETYFAYQVELNAAEIPDKLAVVDLDGTKYTWKQYADDVTRVSNSLLDLGFKKGDKIATLMLNGYDYHCIFMAAATIGLEIVGLDLRFTIDESVALLKRTLPKALFSSAYPVAELVKEAPPLQFVYSQGEGVDYPEAVPFKTLYEGSLTPIADELHPDVDDPLIYIFTSGTTGQPKGGMITHRNTWHISKNAAESWKFTNDDVVVCYMSTSHVADTHDSITLAIYAGAASVCMKGFDPDELMATMEKYGVTYILTIPTVFRLLLLKVDFSKYDTSAMRCLVLSGEFVSAELANSVNAYFPNASVVSSWGMTETAGYFTMTLVGDDIQLICDTEGAPRGWNKMKALKDDGEWGKVGELGELCITGPQVIPGYMEEKHNEGTFFHKDSARWMKTGDTGYMDEMGYMHYVGRCKEMYISGGYNVYPPEIEKYISAHEKVNAVAVLGVDDPVWGEIGYAFIQLEQGAEMAAEEVIAYCKEGLAGYKVPKKVFIRTELPKTGVGKIEKKTIKNNLDLYTN